MNPAAAPGRLLDTSPDAATTAPGGRRFWAHVAALGFLYLAMVVAWGERNAWPDELLVCVLALPITATVAWHLFQTEQFGISTDTLSGQQEQLIAALVIALGLASGQLVLMSGGLCCLGVGWLRPNRPDVDWAEWLKIPLLFLGCLPFWLDFDAGRAALAPLLEDPIANPVYRLPLALATTQAQLLAYFGLTALSLALRGRTFWIALPLLPAFIALITLAPRALPLWAQLHPNLRLALPWILGAAVVGLIGQGIVPLAPGSLRIAPGGTLRRWFAERRHPPWIAVLVIAVTQAVPLHSTTLASAGKGSLAGMALLIGLLVLLRSRTSRGPIHSRSTAMVAGALALTLLGEFTGSELARRVALGLVVIGLLSWHCFWSLRIFAAAALATLALLGLPAECPLAAIPTPILATARIAAATVALASLAFFTVRPLPLPGAAGYVESGWVPPKRFALILLGLILLFQLASAFWPEHEMQVPGVSLDSRPSRTGPDAADSTGPRVATLTPASAVTRPGALEGIDLRITHPRRIPYLVESPYRSLERHGWQIGPIRHFPHPLGESAGLTASRGPHRVAFLWWFEQGGSAFANHRYARRVLWSSWYLANRDLRLVTLQSTVRSDPAQLVDHARRNDWFRPDPAPALTP
jgi:hypothetical protein